MNKKLIQRERNRLANRGIELTPDQCEELLLHKLRCIDETITIVGVASKLFARKADKASKSFSEFAHAAVLFENLEG